MSDLDLIKDLEQHAGFVLNRLTCDGNIYAQRISLGDASKAHNLFIESFVALRKSLRPHLSPEQVTGEAAVSSMDDFDAESWDE